MLYYFFFTSFFIYLDLTFYLWEANYPEAAASKKAADYSLCKESGNNHRIIKKKSHRVSSSSLSTVGEASDLFSSSEVTRSTSGNC